MLRKEIKFINLDGDEATAVAYFHMGTAEVLDMEARYPQGWVNTVKSLIDRQDGVGVYNMFVDLVGRAYGRKSEDGSRFIKSPEALQAFRESPAWDEFFLELLSDSEKAGQFFQSILPKNFHEQAKKFREQTEKSVAAKSSETGMILGFDKD